MPFLPGVPVIPLPFEMLLVKLQSLQDVLSRLVVRNVGRDISFGIIVPEADPLDLIRLFLVQDVVDYMLAKHSVFREGPHANYLSM